MPSPPPRLPPASADPHGVAVGRVLMVQETRFLLEAEGGGAARPFVLSHRAPLGEAELASLCDSGERVTVRFAPSRFEHASVALRIYRETA